MRNDVYVGMLVSRDSLKHYGVGHLNGGHSGRYPWGSGKRPGQREEKLRKEIQEYYKKNPKNANIEKGYQKRRLRQAGVDTSNPKYDVIKAGSSIGRYSSNPKESLDNRKYVWLTSVDREAYKDAASFGGLGANKDDKIYRYELKAKRDIKVAKAEDVSRYIMSQYHDIGVKYMHDFINSIDHNNAWITTRNLRRSKDVHEKTMGQYVFKGQQLIADFFHTKVFSNPKGMDDLINHFKSEGYDAIVDPEDEVLNYSYPVILLKPDEVVESTKVHRVVPYKN